MRRFDRTRARDLWHRHPHPLLAHRPCPPVAHSITPAALFSSACTFEVSGSSGRIALDFAELTEKRVPATLADFLADCELDSHDKTLCWPTRRRLTLFADFFLFNIINSNIADSLNRNHVSRTLTKYRIQIKGDGRSITQESWSARGSN